ncbi:MAG: MBL fold metallo-hydrolase [Lautropia sp.]|nr:MBL fold metallo-hydrolase [Lautropia sp.]
MKLSHLLGAMGLSISLLALGACTTTRSDISGTEKTTAQQLSIQHIRNATAKIDYAGKTFLIDPMLAPKDAYPGFEGTANSHLRNPLTDLPMPVAQILDGVDAVIVTHTHLDHWDGAAQERIPKNLPIFVQNEADAGLIRGQGFSDVRIVGERTRFDGVTLSKTGGQHGTDQMYAVPQLASRLGEAMGVVLQADERKSIYILGDTIWRPEVDQALQRYEPDILIMNTGYAQVTGFDGSIIMGKDDIVKAYRAVPRAKLIAVHMDAINHTVQTRADLREFVQHKGMQVRVLIPADGERMSF